MDAIGLQQYPDAIYEQPLTISLLIFLGLIHFLLPIELPLGIFFMKSQDFSGIVMTLCAYKFTLIILTYWNATSSFGP